MTITIYVSRDASALAVGAEQVARGIAAQAARGNEDVRIVRNGSRGMFWLEPLVEVATPAGRIAYGPVQVKDIEGLFTAGCLQGAAHPTKLGKLEDIAYFRKQERLTFARVGITDPRSIEHYRSHDGLFGLKRALDMAPADIVKAVKDSRP
jgi:formate dehydrogenase iron-sulfur subunit